ncbi:MAG: transposase [Candidatus Parabeggiatoa sp. nov. 1]|nr:MAG: transposase [Gammaproteobacteria bacterium]
MAVTLSHKICLDPTYKQEQYFKQACGTARFTWNWALNEWQHQYESALKPTALKLKKQFNAIKKVDFPWTYEVTKYASQQPFMFLQTAFNRFFNGTSSYPKFKKKGHHDSFYIGNDQFNVKGNRLKIPKLGAIKMHETLRFCGELVSGTISRIADKWFVSLSVKLESAPTSCESQAGVGIDLGIKSLATLSDGEIFEAPKPLKKYLLKLKRFQRRLCRRQKESHNRYKLKQQIAKIVNIRQNSLHQLTSYLTTHFGGIAIEDLNVKGMLANHKLARAIADIGFYEFRRQLEYKSKLKGNYLLIAERWFPSSKQCSACGNKKAELKLSERVYRCDSCGLELDRDLNAAINLKNVLNTGSSSEINACGQDGSVAACCDNQLG